MRIFMNGHFVENNEALISVLDLGLLRGYSVFDFLRTYNNKPFHLQDHLERLHYSASQLGIALPYSFEEMETIVLKLLKDSPHLEHGIKILITGGISEDQFFPGPTPTFIAFAYPLSPYSFPSIRVTTTRCKRSLPQCKTTHYLEGILSLQAGKKHEAKEALYLNEKNEILEALTSNFFAFRDGVLLTPPEEGILLGITRSIVLKICESMFPIQTRPISFEEIPFIDEIFLSASNKEILPVTHIDGSPIGNGEIGPLTQQVMYAFRKYVQSESWPPLFISRHLECTRKCERI